MRKTYRFIASLVILLVTASAQAQIQPVNDSELSKVSGQYAEIGIVHLSGHLVSSTVHIAALAREDVCSAHQQSLALASRLASDIKSDASALINGSIGIIKTKLHSN